MTNESESVRVKSLRQVPRQVPTWGKIAVDSLKLLVSVVSLVAILVTGAALVGFGLGVFVGAVHRGFSILAGVP